MLASSSYNDLQIPLQWSWQTMNSSCFYVLILKKKNMLERYKTSDGDGPNQRLHWLFEWVCVCVRGRAKSAAAWDELSCGEAGVTSSDEVMLKGVKCASSSFCSPSNAVSPWVHSDTQTAPNEHWCPQCWCVMPFAVCLIHNLWYYSW